MVEREYDLSTQKDSIYILGLDLLAGNDCIQDPADLGLGATTDDTQNLENRQVHIDERDLLLVAGTDSI